MNQTTLPKTNGSVAQRAKKFLMTHTSGVLATTCPDGTPHASVVYYTLDNGAITFITKTHTQKSENLQHDGRADFVVYDEKSQTVVQLTGRAQTIKDSTRSSQVFRNALKASLHTAGSAIPPISKLPAGDYVAYQLRPNKARIVTYNQRGSNQPSGLFESFSLRKD